MYVRVQVILGEEEAAKFKFQAQKESKALSAWLREAGKKMLKMNQQRESLIHPATLKTFFDKCKQREQGKEPDWEDHRRLILDSMQAGNRP